MTKITPLDRLFVTIFQKGIASYATELTGVNSFSDIVSHMRSHLPGISGMTTISVRNSTEGWSDTRSVFMY